MNQAGVVASVGEASLRRVRLADLCEFKPSKSIPRKKLSDDDPVSFVPMSDLGELEKYFQAQGSKPFGEVVSGYTYFANGDVLCAKITPCFENGKLGIAKDLVNGVGFGSSEFVVMRPKPELSPEYLYYFLARDEFREAGAHVMTGAVGHKRVPKEYFEELLVPLPNMDEQKRIVAILDQAFAALDRARAHAEANLADADSLYASALDEMIRQSRSSWDAGTVSSLVGEVSTGPFGSLLHKRDYIDGGVPIINPSNIVEGAIEPDWTKTVSAETAERLGSYRLCADDLVIGRRGEMGRCAPVLPEMDGWLCGTGSFIVRPKPEVSPEFVSYLMRSRMIVDRLSAIATGATMPNLSNRALAQMPFELPAYDVQIAMLAEMKALEAKTADLRAAFAAKLTDITALRQSLLQQAFCGQLT